MQRNVRVVVPTGEEPFVAGSDAQRRRRTSQPNKHGKHCARWLQQVTSLSVSVSGCQLLLTCSQIEFVANTANNRGRGGGGRLQQTGVGGEETNRRYDQRSQHLLLASHTNTQHTRLVRRQQDGSDGGTHKHPAPCALDAGQQ